MAPTCALSPAAAEVETVVGSLAVGHSSLLLVLQSARCVWPPIGRDRISETVVKKWVVACWCLAMWLGHRVCITVVP